MPVVSGGNTVDKDSILRGYEKDKMYGLAKDFLQVANAGLDEGYDIYSEPQKFINEASLRNSMEQFFLENTFDRKDPDFQDAAAVREHEIMITNCCCILEKTLISKMQQQFVIMISCSAHCSKTIFRVSRKLLRLVLSTRLLVLPSRCIRTF